MRPRNVAYLVVLALLLVFVLANWGVIERSTEINFLLVRLTAPLGLLILAIAALIFLIDLVAHAFARRAWSQERRGLAEEVQQLRLRVDQAEGTRLTELRDLVERETAVIRGQLDRVLASIERK